MKIIKNTITMFKVTVTCALFFAQASLAQIPYLNSLRSISHDDRVQLLLDVTAQPNVNFSLERNPSRLMVDVQATPSQNFRNLLSFRNRGITRLRTQKRRDGTMRLVIELNGHYPFEVYAKASDADYVVIDVYDRAKSPKDVQARILQSRQQVVAQEPQVSAPNPVIKLESGSVKADDTVVSDQNLQWHSATTAKETKPVQVKKVAWSKKVKKQSKPEKNFRQTASLVVPEPVIRKSNKTMLVIIDPGHGGKDSGAIGANGTQEKTVVLQIAKRLKRHIDSLPNMRAQLTRSSDRFIPLRGRTRIAKKKRADLFISIHADAVRRRNVQGASVYILSTGGASSEAARELARGQNSVDSRFGINYKDYDRDVQKVLMNMEQSATIESSYVLAQKTLGKLKGIGKVHKRYVERAGFAVLKSTSIPSMLVETAFISNPKEEAKLKDPAYQEEIARAIAKGVNRYFSDNLPQHILLGQGQ